jgi:hypothetical protein
LGGAPPPAFANGGLASGFLGHHVGGMKKPSRMCRMEIGGGAPKRFWAWRKSQAVLRLLRGEDIDLASRESGVTVATLFQWRDTFPEAGESGLTPYPIKECVSTTAYNQGNYRKRLCGTLQPHSARRLAGSASIGKYRRGQGLRHQVTLDLRQRTTQYGPRRHHPGTETENGCIALLFRPPKKGRITRQPDDFRARKGIEGRSPIPTARRPCS